MRKPVIKVKVIKEDTGYSGYSQSDKNLITTQGETFEELRINILEAVNLTFEDKPFVYREDEIQFQFDLESFFDFYRVINTKALAERIGMNQSLLSQYIKGIKKPSASQTRRILNGVRQIGRELSEVQFLL